jgi:hypothetical protein
MTWQRFVPRRIQYGSNSDDRFSTSRRQRHLLLRLPTPTPMPMDERLDADADHFDFDSNDGLIKFSIGRVIR